MIRSLWLPPDTESLRTAIARCFHLMQREHGITLGEIAHAAGCNAETIRKAHRREATLGLEFWARLRFYFRETPHVFEPYEQLVNPDGYTESPTDEERIERIERHLRVLRGKVAA